MQQNIKTSYWETDYAVNLYGREKISLSISRCTCETLRAIYRFCWINFKVAQKYPQKLLKSCWKSQKLLKHCYSCLLKSKSRVAQNRKSPALLSWRLDVFVALKICLTIQLSKFVTNLIAPFYSTKYEEVQNLCKQMLHFPSTCYRITSVNIQLSCFEEGNLRRPNGDSFPENRLPLTSSKCKPLTFLRPETPATLDEVVTKSTEIFSETCI